MPTTKRRKPAPRAPFVVTLAVAAAAAGCGGEALSEDDGSGGSSGVSGSGAGGSGGSSGSSSGGVGGGSGGTGGGSGGVGGNPPIPECPTDPPARGSSCALLGMTCHYGCEFGNDITATCDGGDWRVGITSCNPPPPPACPTEEPMWGQSCSEPGQVCTYGDPGACCGPAEWHCEGGQWENWTGTCNPPPPEPCPESLPEEGSACGSPDPCFFPAQSCTYGDCLSPEGRTTAECVLDDGATTGRWQHVTLICN